VALWVQNSRLIKTAFSLNDFVGRRPLPTGTSPLISPKSQYCSGFIGISLSTLMSPTSGTPFAGAFSLWRCYGRTRLQA
jgi:hypothetical protein